MFSSLSYSLSRIDIIHSLLLLLLFDGIERNWNPFWERPRWDVEEHRREEHWERLEVKKSNCKECWRKRRPRETNLLIDNRWGEHLVVKREKTLLSSGFDHRMKFSVDIRETCQIHSWQSNDLEKVWRKRRQRWIRVFSPGIHPGRCSK